MLQLEAALRTKEKEVEKMGRALDAAKAAEAEVRMFESGTWHARAFYPSFYMVNDRVHTCSSTLNATYEETSVCLLQVLARQQAIEEVARKMDSQASALRQRLVQQAGSMKLKEQQAARVERALEGARAAEQDAYERRAEVGGGRGLHIVNMVLRAGSGPQGKKCFSIPILVHTSHTTVFADPG